MRKTFEYFLKINIFKRSISDLKENWTMENQYKNRIESIGF